MKTYIKGNYRKSIYKSDKGYVIGLFKVRETNDPKMEDFLNKTVTFTGYFHDLNEDDTYFFYGEAADHPKYGFQYQVSEYERIKPADQDGIIAFLSSDLFSGIGESMARNIVLVLGDETLDKIINDKSCLMMVPKLSTKKANNIYETLIKYEESHKTIVYLTDLGFNMRDALNIYNIYRNNTISIIENNIFQIIEDVNELSFLKVDEISRHLTYLETDHRRIEACIVYIMSNLVFASGDTYLLKEDIYKETINYLKQTIDSELFLEYLDNLKKEGKIVVENNCYYLKSIYEAEVNIVKKIRILNGIPPVKHKKIDEYITALEVSNNIIYNDKQKKAITKAMEDNLLIITGGPGTGKTTIIKAITSLYQQLNGLKYDKLVEEVALLAPTGRASKRMSEATLLPAMTIHRFLKWNKDSNEFGINEKNKDHSKLIIIDEVSMIDINLLDSLFKGLTDNIKVIFVGDYNQLPSVGPGQILKDLIESDIIETIHLDLLYRQDEYSYIPTLALEIKSNTLSDNYLDPRSDYSFLQCNNNSIKSNLRTLCEQVIKKGYDYKRVQIMAPMYGGENGIDSLNKELQEVFNPKDDHKKEIIYGDITFRENDKILQLVNMPDENIFNGDIGYIKQIIYANVSDSHKNEIYVDYDGNLVKYSTKDFLKIKHGFIISIHKSQGSEFEMVIIPISSSYHRMLYRKLIYTGITRAKKKLILLGEPTAFIYSVEHNNEYLRKTSLLERLINIYK